MGTTADLATPAKTDAVASKRNAGNGIPSTTPRPAPTMQRQVIGKYELGRVLATGDFDRSTRLCWHLATGVPYVIRIYDKRILAEAQWMWDRVSASIQAQRTLGKHRNILEMVECFESQTSVYIVMHLFPSVSMTKVFSDADARRDFLLSLKAPAIGSATARWKATKTGTTRDGANNVGAAEGSGGATDDATGAGGDSQGSSLTTTAASVERPTSSRAVPSFLLPRNQSMLSDNPGSNFGASWRRRNQLNANISSSGGGAGEVARVDEVAAAAGAGDFNAASSGYGGDQILFHRLDTVALAGPKDNATDDGGAAEQMIGMGLLHLSQQQQQQIWAAASPQNFPIRVIRNLFEQLVEGVLFLHRNNVAHTGLAPDHVLLGINGTLKLGNLLTCCYCPPDKRLHDLRGTRQTVAPEVLKGESYDPFLADAWSIGVIFYFMLNNGRYPHDGANTLQHIQHGKLRPSRAGLPFVAKDLLSRLLQSAPDERLPVEAILAHPFFSADLPDEESVPGHRPMTASTTATGLSMTASGIMSFRRQASLASLRSGTSRTLRSPFPDVSIGRKDFLPPCIAAPTMTTPQSASLSGDRGSHTQRGAAGSQFTLRTSPSPLESLGPGLTSNAATEEMTLPSPPVQMKYPRNIQDELRSVSVAHSPALVQQQQQHSITAEVSGRRSSLPWLSQSTSISGLAPPEAGTGLYDGHLDADGSTMVKPKWNPMEAASIVDLEVQAARLLQYYFRRRAQRRRFRAATLALVACGGSNSNLTDASPPSAPFLEGSTLGEKVSRLAPKKSFASSRVIDSSSPVPTRRSTDKRSQTLRWPRQSLWNTTSSPLVTQGYPESNMTAAFVSKDEDDRSDPAVFGKRLPSISGKRSSVAPSQRTGTGDGNRRSLVTSLISSSPRRVSAVRTRLDQLSNQQGSFTLFNATRNAAMAVGEVGSNEECPVCHRPPYVMRSLGLKPYAGSRYVYENGNFTEVKDA